MGSALEDNGMFIDENVNFPWITAELEDLTHFHVRIGETLSLYGFPKPLGAKLSRPIPMPLAIEEICMDSLSSLNKLTFWKYAFP